MSRLGRRQIWVMSSLTAALIRTAEVSHIPEGIATAQRKGDSGPTADLSTRIEARGRKLFDQLVRAGKQCRRHGNRQRLRGLEVDM